MSEFNPDERLVASGLKIEEIYCPSCNSPNPLGTTFCVHCSSYLGDLEDAPISEIQGDDALDTLIARKAEEDAAAAEEAAKKAAIRMPSDPPPAGAEVPMPTPGSPPAGPGAVVDSESGDTLAHPVQLADGRVITKASTLAKLTKLQNILGDAGPLTGATEAKNEVVMYLEKKVADQAAALEKLQKEKEAIIAEYMADALGSEGDEVDENALEQEKLRADRAETEAARLSKAEAELSAKLMQKDAEVAAAHAEVEKLKGQLLGSGVDVGVPHAEVEQLKAQLQTVRNQLQGAQAQLMAAPAGGGAETQQLMARVQELEGRLAAGAEERQKLVDMAEAKVQQIEQEKERAIAMARQAMEQQDQQIAQLKSQPPASGGVPPEQLQQAQAENAKLREQLEALSSGAKEQVRTVTRYYERILARTPCGVVVLAANGVILSVNGEGARMLGTPAANLLRKAYNEFPVLAPFHPFVQKVLAEGGELGPEIVALEVGTGDPVRTRFTAGKGELGAREVCVLVLDDLTPDPESVPPPRDGGDGGGGSGGGIDPARLATMQEDLFGLRMMLELLVSKSSNPNVVQEIAGDLLKDLDRVIESLKS